MSDAAELRERTTGLLVEAATDGAAAETLFPLVYDELRRLARRQLAGEMTGHTLSTTALVHEAYIRLVDGSRIGPVGRGYFFGAAARAMRRILVEHARRRRAAKRGGGQNPVSLGEADAAADAYADELIDLDRALEELATLNPRHARVVECRFFGGLDTEETAAVLGVSDRTVKSDWAVARAWLRQAMGG
jgi:RNA polymerase sigma factor (TIGR02999 family)